MTEGVLCGVATLTLMRAGVERELPGRPFAASKAVRKGANAVDTAPGLENADDTAPPLMLLLLLLLLLAPLGVEFPVT